MSLLDHAIAFAAIAHQDQRRKYTGEPYIVHPIEVMQIAATRGGLLEDEEALMAAVLHDVVEDTAISVENISISFGERVAALVGELTEVRVEGNRAVRKAAEVERLSKVSDIAQTIKLADLMSNTKSIIRYDPGFAKVYLAEKKELMKVLIKGHPALYDRVRMQLDTSILVLEMINDDSDAPPKASRTA